MEGETTQNSPHLQLSPTEAAHPGDLQRGTAETPQGGDSANGVKGLECRRSPQNIPEAQEKTWSLVTHPIPSRCSKSHT